MFRRRTLETVFTMGPSPSRHTYVDRGELDQRVRASLAGGIHVVMHGESKHGKSWLRARTLPDKMTARVQCLPGMSASEILEQALGRLGVHESLRILIEDTSETRSSGGGSVSVKAIKLEGAAEGKVGHRRTVEQQLVGQDRSDLGWVAEAFRDRHRTPVFEDFHNLDAEAQFAMAYIMKAMGEWGVPCVIVGIWTDTHLLKLYNGELDGRVEDLKLQWTFDELQEVVRRGCAALHVRISDELRSQLARDAYTSVGLLQELTKAMLQAAGIERRGWRMRTLDDQAALTAGRIRVVAQISSRFDPFVQLFPRASLENVRASIYPGLSRLVTDRLSERDLLAGIDVARLHRELVVDDAELGEQEVVTGLESIEAAQRSVHIRPSVLAFDAARQRMILADRRLLLYLRERPPH